MSRSIMTLLYQYPVFEKIVVIFAGMLCYYLIKSIDTWREENGYAEKEEA